MGILNFFKKNRISALEETMVKRAIYRVISNRSYYLLSGQPELKKLEGELSSFLGGARVLGVSSGTDALIFALKVIGIGVDDEVIVPALGFISTASSVVWVGAKPVFVDIRPHGYNIDPTKIEPAITERTKAIIVTHLFGQPAALNEIIPTARKHNIPIIEDAAQAFGSKIFINEEWKSAGTIANMGCFSFSSTKHFSVFGSGGAIATNEEKLFNKLFLMRDYGAERHYYEYPVAGVNGRLQEIHAATLRVKFMFLDFWLKHRSRIAELYSHELSGVGDIVLPEEDHNTVRVFYRYVLRTSKREQLFTYLCDKFSLPYLKPTKHYPVPLPFFDLFRSSNYKYGDFPISEQVSKETLALPLTNFVSEKDALQVCHAIKDFFIKGS